MSFLKNGILKINIKWYILNITATHKIKDEINNTLYFSVIVHKTCACASRIVVVVKKPNGDIRLCTDYRELNKTIEFDFIPSHESTFRRGM